MKFNVTNPFKKPVAATPKKAGNGVSVLSLSSAYQAPSIGEEKASKGEYITYGENNDYYDCLIDYFTTSPTNARCVNGIADLIFGQGLETTSEDRKEFAKVQMLMGKEDIRKIAVDLKLLGQGMAQVTYNKSKTKIVRFSHTPTQAWRAKKADSKGSIPGYYKHHDWPNAKKGDNIPFLPMFGKGGKDDYVELLVIRPYRSGYYYYSPVDYAGCTQYCQLESEVSNFHINNIQNGLQPSLLINFNNGEPDEEAKQQIERKIQDKFGGTTNAGRFILAFNDDPDTAATIDPIHLPDAHAQYQFLSDEAREKIMLGHGITSPILLGIKDNTGFGNNAEELRTASLLMDSTIIKPFQNLILDALHQVLRFNKCFVQLYFKTLLPIEFTGSDEIKTNIRREEETGEKLGKQTPSESEVNDFTDSQGDEMIEILKDKAEKIPEGWVIDSVEKVEDNVELAERNTANTISKYDNIEYKVRYRYAPVRNNPKSRRFCKNMESLVSQGYVWRKEDIDQMSFMGVNRELGHKRQNYSLFKYKGGKNCHHYWERLVIVRATGEETDPSKVKDQNPDKNIVETRPVDMPNRGAYPI